MSAGVNPPLVCLFGPTASGKTALSVRLAHRLNAEIISVDSSLVYRGLDIGTAKPTEQEREGVVHHLIDICDPGDVYSAARFRDDAGAVIDALQARGQAAILCGGTMLYFKALLEGLAPLPDADPALRLQLQAELEARGSAALHAELARVDAVAAARIHPNDPQRLLRALEVFRLSGRPLSELQGETRSTLPVTPYRVALLPAERAWLHQRISARFDAMLAAGFLEEVRALRARGDLAPDLPAMRAVGYRQAWAFLDGNGDEITFRERALAATRQLAKRQHTWIRSTGAELTLSCDRLTVDAQLEAVCAGLAARQPDDSDT